LPTAASVVAAARDRESGDFLRGGNPVSVAAQQALEIHAEIRFHDFAALAPTGVAEDQVVLDWLIHRGGEIEVDRLVVGRFEGEQSLAGAIAGRIGLLLLVQDEEVDIRGFVGCPVYLADERLEDSVEMRLGSMGGNFESKCGRDFQVERFL
jgi:hypothetical protein